MGLLVVGACDVELLCPVYLRLVLLESTGPIQWLKETRIVPKKSMVITILFVVCPTDIPLIDFIKNEVIIEVSPKRIIAHHLG